MFNTNDPRHAHIAGREVQFTAMMEALSSLEAKYRGVRGELLKKVRAEFEQLKPPSSGLTVVHSEPAKVRAPKMCAACGREMRLNGTDGGLTCMNGHRA